MNKYIAFDLYRKNELGGNQPAFKHRPDGVNVLLVADIETLLWNIESSTDPAAVARTALRELMEPGAGK